MGSSFLWMAGYLRSKAAQSNDPSNFDHSDNEYAKGEAIMKRIGYMLVADVALMAGLTFM